MIRAFTVLTNHHHQDSNNTTEGRPPPPPPHHSHKLDKISREYEETLHQLLHQAILRLSSDMTEI